MGNWTSVFAFAFIVFAMIGGIKNKYQYKVKIPVKEVKGFTPCTIISTVIIGLGLWFLIVSAVANVPLVATWHSQIGDIDPINGEYTNSDWTKQMVGVSVTLGLLFVFFGVTAIPSYVAVKKESTPIRGGGSNDFDIKGLKDKEKVIIYKPKDLKKAKA